MPYPCSRGDERKSGRARIEPLGAHELLRFLVALVGPAAAAWPRAPFRSEAELVEKLVALVAEVEPESLTLSIPRHRAPPIRPRCSPNPTP